MSKIIVSRKNDERDMRAIADGYAGKIKHDLWLADGLQKDAIQNSWDVKRKDGEWECGFSLININGVSVLCIADQGTTGLDGKKFNDE